MTAFYDLPVPVQNLTSFWALLICLCCIAETILLFRQKRRLLSAAAGLCFFGEYFVLHVCREGTKLRLHGRVNPFAMRVLLFPSVAFLAACLLITLFCILLYRNISSWQKTHIAASSIKESMDGLPAGVCFYLEDGRCIFSNHRMNYVCFSLLGHTLQNGALFYESIKENPIHALSDGSAVSFRHRLLTYKGVPLHELIADDITELYEKSEKLRADNERIRKLTESMKVYSETITDTVRRQEILQAKINIHDEMNRMILVTERSLHEEDPSERQEILRMWQNQALLLCMEADSHKNNSTVADLNALAAAIGIRLIWDGTPTVRDPAVLSLFLAAAREAMTNAAKHAQAETLCISVKEDAASLCASFTNDGKKPDRPVFESGGLLNLRRRLEAVGGQMKVETEPIYCLNVVIPKGGISHAV